MAKTTTAFFIGFATIWALGGMLWLLGDHLVVALAYWAVTLFWCVAAGHTWRTGNLAE